MSEVVNVVVAFAVIVLIFRWATSNGPEGGTPSPADILGFRPKNVTEAMVDTIGNMFPDVPKDNIRYDLLRTGSVERTTNKILERGFLDAPPLSYFNLYPRTTTPGAQGNSLNNAGSSSSAMKPKDTLISRYNLQSKLDDSPTLAALSEVNEVGGGKAKWEDTPEKRETSLRERKEKMILAARQRMLAAQKGKEKESATVLQ
ncbi:hypothetical protein F5050DRAFT_1750612 [Lentinula boryana]|uniref:CUE domain-containing protein n=1 Tax=Lentinula boryana TaxID=40481 RepID=A0ABQ8QGD5_9AGAR|nr:hypothetical protein F5050DRAFT_1750612 [Lentinula boryana]